MLACFGSFTVNAQPAHEFDVKVENLIGAASNEWVRVILTPVDAMDEQIFTEISPLIDSPEGVRLPEDQLLTD